MKIKEIPIQERPREKLLNNGVETLSNEELLAIIIKTGNKKESAKTLAAYILKSIDKIQNLASLNLSKLKKIKGIGSAKACEILAVIELSKRINKKLDSLNNIKITSSNKIFEYYKDTFYNEAQEKFYCIYLDSSNKVISTKLLFTGTINKSNVYPREIFKEAYLNDSVSIICVHNHPSGNIKPSQNDIEITEQIKLIGTMMEVKLLDHIIIGKDSYYSFMDNGKI